MVVLVSPIYPFRGGIANSSAAFVKNLIQNGEEVFVISFSTLYPKFLFPGKTQYVLEQEELCFSTTSIINTLNPLSWVRAAKRIKSLNPKLVVFRYWTPWLSLCYSVIAKNIKVKKIAWIDNALPHERKTVDKYLLGIFLASVNEALCLSKSVAVELKKHTKKEINILFHPVDIDLPPAIAQKDALLKLGLNPIMDYLLFFGLIRPYKGLDLLIKSLPQLRRNKPNTRLLVVGEAYEPMSKYLKLAASLKVDDMVYFHNRFVSSAEIPLWFSVCSWVVQPYKSATQSGITPIAIRYAKPCIVTDVGSLSESISDETGIVCKPDPKDLSNTMVRALTEKKNFNNTRAYELLQRKRSWNIFCIEFIIKFIKK